MILYFFLPIAAPSIIKEVSPSSVICEKQTLCLLSCVATSYTPFNYSWTKDGQVPVGDNIKIMNNSLVITPRDAKDYGLYLCHATNNFGSTAYKITLSECLKTQTPAITGDDSEGCPNYDNCSFKSVKKSICVRLSVVTTMRDSKKKHYPLIILKDKE